MVYDVIVVGGSFAGLSAGMQLARAQRRVLLVDAGRPRNRFAAASHGFLGQDGVAPEAVLSEGRRQLSAYPTLDFLQGEAVRVRSDDTFTVGLADGGAVEGRRLVLATGLIDDLPLPSMQMRWGVSVLHCPYCHGYEVRGRPLAVVASNPMSIHQALLLPDWGPTTLFTQGQFEPTLDEAGRLALRSVDVERVPVVELLGDAPHTEALRLADGRIIAAQAVFTAPRTRMASSLAEQLGCAFEDGPTGPYIQVDAVKRTTISGVFAAGDAAQGMHNATLASAAGVLAGVSAHRSLVLAQAAA
ncbi:MAG: NAD(P)/FAD-dependent oxidoreductase [Phenylobacterium sp.]|uniref:NAD(P)/FAD-dependent oxidoreductase n=1 Tax=Phenylobacterium sp. TaxID=1871053 RepID=UPI0027367E08|nr:NAD(P)/FAD-dependent oxidoreductase [Phenylobacterium sp.]MDP3747399.1 NAD(P)/FAD-dependent oxidoreductase [Phenylobacterium sp.]